MDTKKPVIPNEKRIRELIESVLNANGNNRRIALVLEYTKEIEEGVSDADR